MDAGVVAWLLEPYNPGVRVRTLVSLCGLPADDAEVVAARREVLGWLEAARDPSWMSGSGLALIYGLVALAESGLTCTDVAADELVSRLLAQPFDAGCGDMVLLRGLVMLGYGGDDRVQRRLAQVADTRLPDGGWLCLHRLAKLRRTPKSCIKAAMHGLLLAAEASWKGLPEVPGTEELVSYFVRRRLFYRSDGTQEAALPAKPGWRMQDVFLPAEVMRVGLPMLLDALATLGAGKASELAEAWALLGSKLDAHGRVILDGTLRKPYLPRERVGRAAKWPTFYAVRAWQCRER